MPFFPNPRKLVPTKLNEFTVYKPKGINRIAKICLGYLCLREKTLLFQVNSFGMFFKLDGWLYTVICYVGGGYVCFSIIRVSMHDW